MVLGGVCSLGERFRIWLIGGGGSWVSLCGRKGRGRGLGRGVGGGWLLGVGSGGGGRGLRGWRVCCCREGS